MNCEEFQIHLYSAVENRDHHCSSVNIGEHVQNCETAACQQAWAEYQLLSNVVSVWQASLQQIQLADGVIDRLRGATGSVCSIVQSHSAPECGGDLDGKTFIDRETVTSITSRKRHAGIRGIAALACAAACVLLLVPLLRLVSSPEFELAHMNRKGRASSGSEIGPDQTRRTSTVGLYAGVPQSATEFVTDAMVLFVPADLSDSEEEPPTRSEQWRGRLSEQLEPISRELGTAVDAFLKVVNQPQQRST